MIFLGLAAMLFCLVFRAFPAPGARYAQSFYRWTRASLAWNLIGWLVVLGTLGLLWQEQLAISSERYRVLEQRVLLLHKQQEAYQDYTMERLDHLGRRRR